MRRSFQTLQRLYFILRECNLLLYLSLTITVLKSFFCHCLFFIPPKIATRQKGPIRWMVGKLEKVSKNVKGPKTKLNSSHNQQTTLIFSTYVGRCRMLKNAFIRRPCLSCARSSITNVCVPVKAAVVAAPRSPAAVPALFEQPLKERECARFRVFFHPLGTHAGAASPRRSC